MKFIFLLAFSALSSAALGGVYIKGGSARALSGRGGYRYEAAPAPAAAPYTAPEEDTKPEYVAPKPADMCWTETKKCCYKEKADGYECKDNYATKQARCHPKIKYEKKCEKSEADGKPEKPEGMVKYEETEMVHYDQGYGPHVEGYPAGGCSEPYDTKDLPTKPYKVEGEPVADYKPPAPAPAYKAPESTPAYKAAPAPAPKAAPGPAPAYKAPESTPADKEAPAPAPAPAYTAPMAPASKPTMSY